MSRRLDALFAEKVLGWAWWWDRQERLNWLTPRDLSDQPERFVKDRRPRDIEEWSWVRLCGDTDQKSNFTQSLDAAWPGVEKAVNRLAACVFTLEKPSFGSPAIATFSDKGCVMREAAVHDVPATAVVIACLRAFDVPGTEIDEAMAKDAP